jgi:hypothetical protein
MKWLLWMEVKTLHREQNSHIQSNTQTSLNLWNATVGYGFHFKHRNPRILSNLLYVSFIPTSHNRPSTHQLQKSATEHSSTRKFLSHKLQQA